MNWIALYVTFLQRMQTKVPTPSCNPQDEALGGFSASEVAQARVSSGLQHRF